MHFAAVFARSGCKTKSETEESAYGVRGRYIYIIGVEGKLQWPNPFRTHCQTALHFLYICARYHDLSISSTRFDLFNILFAPHMGEAGGEKVKQINVREMSRDRLFHK